jgi:hypothetical protein
MKNKTKTIHASPTRSDVRLLTNPGALDEFFEVAQELVDLHYKKSLDYGTEGDTYQNFRGSEKLGIPSWKGAFIRLMDKVQRIQKFAKDNKLANEGVIDSFNDLAVYAIICRNLYEESIR